MRSNVGGQLLLENEYLYWVTKDVEESNEQVKIMGKD